MNYGLGDLEAKPKLEPKTDDMPTLFLTACNNDNID